MFSTSWKKAYDKLENITSILKIANGYLLVDPNGMYIYLIEIQDIPDMDFPGITPSVLGNYAGVSIECIDLRKSEEFWKLLGFEKRMGSIEQGWITMVNNKGMTLSLMIANSCPHMFYTPSLTYFNGKSNLAIIEKIKELSVPITEEITHFNDEDIVDNIIIRDPGGLGFFIFND